MPEKKTKRKGGGGSASGGGRKGRSGGRNLPIVILMALIVFVLGIVYLSHNDKPHKEVTKDRDEAKTVKEDGKKKEPVQSQPKKDIKERQGPAVVASIPPKQRPDTMISRPKISIIIDDIGNMRHIDDEALSIEAPITVAIFPLLGNSENAAKKALASGKEVMLHLPMEPHDYPHRKPGEGALMTDMDDISIITQLYEDMKSVPGMKGVNNHMGSKFTEDKARMGIVLKQFKDKGIYFVDSKTSPKSNSFELAEQAGLRAASRDIFLDNEQDEKYISKQIEELKKIARKKGYSIGIGHPYPATIFALKKYIPQLREEFDLVPASEIVK